MSRGPSSSLIPCLALSALLSCCVPSALATPAATATTLTVTVAGNPVNGTIPEGVVTLTATVSSNSAKVTIGQVEFCDASVSYCTDVHSFGTAQLTSSGIAVLKFVPPIGSHSYKAVFLGTKSLSPSASAPFNLTTTGSVTSFTTLASGATTSTVVGSGPASPSGTVSIINADNSESITTAALPPAVSGSGAFFLYVTGYFSASEKLSGPAITGDFNGDGFLDYIGNAVELGDGKGGFTQAPGTTTSASTFSSVGDFNMDGILDIADPEGVLLGNGDGTFKQGQGFTLTSSVKAMITGDFNGDGISDLAFLSPPQVLVYLGNGDGTFTPSTLAPPSTDANAASMAAGDFNGDGLTDLVVTTGSTATLEVFLSNGDGTFTAGAPISVGSEAGLIVTGDFSGNGNLDLAVATSAPGLEAGIETFLGDGHGDFSAGPLVSFPSSLESQFVAGMSYLAVGDFNGDGALDLIAIGQVQRGGEAGIAFGNSDGTFQQFSVLTNPGVGGVAAVGDFHGYGITDILGNNALYISEKQIASATFSGFPVPGSGTFQVFASYSGDSNYQPSSSPTITVNAPQGTPTVKVSAQGSSITEGSPLTVTVTGGGLVPTGTVTIHDGSGTLGSATLNSSGMATIGAGAVSLGTNSITASYAGDANYVAAVSPALNVTVTALGTTAAAVTVTPASTSVVSGGELAVSVVVGAASGSPTPTGWVNLTTGSYLLWQPLSNGAASFTIPAGTLTKTGTVALTASYSGDSVYTVGAGTVNVTVGAVSIAASPLAGSEPPGVSLPMPFTVKGDYQGTVNLVCTLTTSPAGAQDLPTCSVSPASVTVSPGAIVSSTATFSSTVASTTSLHRFSGGNAWRRLGGGAVLALLFMGGSWRRRRWISMLLLLLLLPIIATMGCGGGSKGTSTGKPGTTAGNYIFTLTATDAANSSITASTTTTFTVN